MEVVFAKARDDGKTDVNHKAGASFQRRHRRLVKGLDVDRHVTMAVRHEVSYSKRGGTGSLPEFPRTRECLLRVE